MSGLGLTAAVFVAYALMSGRLSRTALTSPMVFLTLGLVVGPRAADLLDYEEGLALPNIVLEVTLIVVLFTDATAINSSRWRHEAQVPSRLLSIGLPLTIAAGWGLALLILGDLEVWEAAMLGAMLAPTDAALGQAVVSNPRVPEMIRQGLNVESGLNDGIVLPVFVVFFDAARTTEAGISFSTFLSEIGSELILALAVGVVVGWVGAAAIGASQHRALSDRAWQQIALLGLAFVAFTIADSIGGSGFIAAWVAGLLTGRRLRGRLRDLSEFAEETGNVLTILSFFAFGLALGSIWGDIAWPMVLYGIASLTVIRLVPVFLAFLGSGFSWPSVMYLGWFGPRGIASLILALAVAEVGSLAGGRTIVATAAVTVAFSVYAQGATAWWGSNRYADWVGATTAKRGAIPETAAAPETRVPRRARTSLVGDPVGDTESEHPAG